MKVRDIITEAGFFKTLGQDVASWLTKGDIKKASKIAGAAIDKWAAQVDKLEQAGQNMKDQETYYKFLNQWLGKWLMLGRPYPGKPASFDRQGIFKYIQQAVAQYETGTLPGAPGTKEPEKETPKEAETDVAKLIEPGMQLRFAHPDYHNIQIIARQGKWYLDRLPPELHGQVSRDKETKLYPVLQPANIKKFNQYYNDAADMGKVKEEPAAAL